MTDKSQHGGHRPGAGRKWEGHIKYERVSFVAPPWLIQDMKEAAKECGKPIAEVWRMAAQKWLSGFDMPDDPLMGDI